MRKGGPGEPPWMGARIRPANGLLGSTVFPELELHELHLRLKESRLKRVAGLVAEASGRERRGRHVPAPLVLVDLPVAPVLGLPIQPPRSAWETLSHWAGAFASGRW